MIPLVPPASFAVAAVAVEVVTAAPEVTSKDIRQPVFVAQFTGAVVVARVVTLKKIKSVPAG
jgi:hypothetical protein